ncbi:site-specific integrase [Agrobacterium rosae]|uniref:site-specific integrase n=1 Tax=Agrobacterium rosae TaxID=1972867 RepID=UPI003B9E4B38
MSVRKREWTTDRGEKKSAWICDYVDTLGVRRQKTFNLKKEADKFAATASVEVREGIHVADSASATVLQAAEFWLASGKQANLERATLTQYEAHVRLHIGPLIGTTLLSKLSVPLVRAFEDKLRETGRSQVMVKKLLVSLGSILADAQERGLTTRNVVREKSRGRKKGNDSRNEKRQKGKLKIGVDIPHRDEIKAIIAVLEGRWRALMLTVIFTGLRCSELRGLRWQDVNLDQREIHVRQRADRYGDIGEPKSDAGTRTVPIGPMVVNALKEWRLSCPKKLTGKQDAEGRPIRALDLVFPNGNGNVENHSNIRRRGVIPLQIAAGVTIETEDLDEDGNPVLDAKYPGIHSFRHFYASWLINRPADGGLGLPAKVVQERLGHSSIVMTMDRYGHLFPRGDDAEEVAAAERTLFT